MEIKKVLVIFKTHLDIGFTDFAENVKQKYFDVFIPGAVKTAKALREADTEAKFKWTTGSWLIHEYLRNHPDKSGDEVREAIKNGDICWHGLPCTTHTEIMNEALFNYALSLSSDLDKEFGKKTIAAKMTDVPGHTKAIIPYMKKAGIELLHIGVNPASAVPDVPEIFRWQADNGDRITVIYNGEYGNFTELGDTGVALYFAHTLDNIGGPTPEDVIATFENLRKEVPGAEIVAAELNDAALVLREIEDTLPVVTEEIGDSWIHGTATDPKKLSQFKAAQRYYSDMPDGENKDILARGLLFIPEHTWGLDEKTHLGENKNYIKEVFNSRRHLPNYQKMEKSWEEQRSFLYDAINEMSGDDKERIIKLISEAQREPLSIDGFSEIHLNGDISFDGGAIKFNECGAITALKLNDKIIADESHLLCDILYELFSYDDYIRFHKRYHRIEDDWAYQDFTKVGMEEAITEYSSHRPQAKAYKNGNDFIIKYEFSGFAVEKFGAPKNLDLLISIKADRIDFDLSWFKKDANRVAESISLGFNPVGTNRRISKLGTLISPDYVVSRGNRNLHATDNGIFFDELNVTSLDAAVVAPGKPHLVDYPNETPDASEGFYFNLYNNTWGTNFPMWYSEDARFRFTMSVNG